MMCKKGQTFFLLRIQSFTPSIMLIFLRLGTYSIHLFGTFAWTFLLFWVCGFFPNLHFLWTVPFLTSYFFPQLQIIFFCHQPPNKINFSSDLGHYKRKLLFHQNYFSNWFFLLKMVHFLTLFPQNGNFMTFFPLLLKLYIPLVCGILYPT